MFKNLKSKLEDEAKKIQASVQQYSEQIQQQVGQMRSNTSDAGGSESGSNVTRRFLNTVTGSPSASKGSGQKASDNDSLNYSVGNALMEEVSEGDLLGLDLPPRERRLSGGSTHSNESSLSALFSYIPGTAGSVFDPSESDLDSTFDEVNSGVVKSANSEQVSTALFKLQNRASNYKDKYRDMVRRYNEVVTENNKCRTVLAQTQDKALKRIEKLREEKKTLSEKLAKAQSGAVDSETEAKIADYKEKLDKCVAEIKKNRTKIKELTDENEHIKQTAQGENAEQGLISLETDRVAAEWKERIDKVEEEWTARINKLETDHAIQLATTKAEMHAALENKDREIESLRSKNRALEIQDGQANERWQKKVDELQAVTRALEAEKSDMIEKLSEAKTQGVKAVQDESEKRREALEKEWQEKMEAMKEEHERAIQEKTEEFGKLQSSFDTASQNVSKLEEKLKSSQEKIELLQKEANEKAKEAEQIKVSLVQEQHSQSAQNDLLEKHQEEIERLTAEFEDQIKQLKEHNEIEAHAAVQRYEHLYLESETVRSKNAELEDDIQQVNQKLQQLEMENQGGQEWEQQMEESRHEVSELLEKLSKANEALNEKDDRMKQMQKECEGLKTELAAARDVLSLHEDLQKELEETRRQRDAIELRVNELANETKLAEERLKRERDEFLEEKRRVEESGLLKSSTSEERTNTDNSQSEEQLIHLSGVEASGWGEFNDQPELQQTPPTIHQLSAEITRLSEELDQERTMTGELRAKLTESEENMESARRSSEEAEKKRLDLVERLTALQTETRTIIENLEGENEKIRKENDGFEKEIAHLRESLSGRDADENSRAEAERQREAESAQTQAEFEAQKQRLKEELDVVRQQRLLLEKQIDELKEEKKLLEELNEVLTIDKSALEEKLTKQEDVRSDKASAGHQRVGELEAINEKMRIEFLAKEELVSSLRNELKALRDATDKKIAELNEREDQTKLKLRESAEELEKSTKTIESLQAEIDKLHTQIGKIEEQRNKEKEEENIVRNQYVKALETVKEELLVANGKEKEMKKAEEMRKELEVKVSKLEEELKQKEEQVETVRASASQSTEAAVLDIKQKAEKKLAKLKQTMDGKIEEAQTAKQGAEAEVEKLRASLAEVEKKFDAIVVDKAKLEQQLILRESIEKELQEAKYREEKTSSKVNELEKKIWSLEEEVARIEEEKAESEEERSKLQEALEKNKEEIEQLQEKIKSLSESNEESFRKAAAKQDSESKKVVRELQREVKQLYVELNEKSEALDAARKALEEGGLSAKIIQTTTAAAPRKPADSLEDAGRGTVDHSEELESMRNKLAACHKDLDELRDEKARLERALEAAQKGKSQPATVSVNGGRLDEHPGFADPAEAEYLKNVLYQYMLNRENLGHEALTLARVIGTVAKFDKKELDAIIHKEESRLAGWVGSLNNTVSHLASNAYPSNTGR